MIVMTVLFFTTQLLPPQKKVTYCELLSKNPGHHTADQAY